MTQSIAERWQQLRATQPGLRTRDAAELLGCTEADLVASGAGFDAVHALDSERLDRHLAALIARGRWMWLVRNDAAVLEMDADDLTVSATGGRLLLHGATLDLSLAVQGTARVFYTEALAEAKGPPRSLQIFDAAGTAVAKAYLRRLVRDGLPRMAPGTGASEPPDTRAPRYGDIALARLDAALLAACEPTGEAHGSPSIPHTQIGNGAVNHPDTANRRAYASLCTPLRATQGASDRPDTRAQVVAAESHPRPFSCDPSGEPVDPRSYEALLEFARDHAEPVCLEAANRGARMQCLVVPKRLQIVRDWYNILDPGFNLHLRMSLITCAERRRLVDSCEARFGTAADPAAFTIRFDPDGPGRSPR